MIINYTMWDEIAAALHLKYADKYLTTEQYLTDQPLHPVVVPEGTDKFFGVKNLSLYIVAVPFGWEKDGETWVDNWPPVGLTEAITRHNENYGQFSIYDTRIWMDFNIVRQIMDATPTSQFQSMMEAVEVHIQELVPQLQGFTYMGRINDYIEASYFYPLIDQFLLERAE